MNFLERTAFAFFFLLDKYISISFTEGLLSWFENRMLNKHLVRKERAPDKIPTIQADELTDDRFRKVSNNFRNPVLIKGFMKGTEAVKRWNAKYLEDIVGDFEVNILQNEEELVIRNCTFKEFLNSMKDKPVYLNNNHTILSHFPVLFEDIKKRFNKFVDTISSTNLRNIHIANLFIGQQKSKMTGTNIHCGGSGNFFCMIAGRKRWTLIAPQYSCLLKGRVAVSGIHAQSLFDMQDTDLSVYPKIFKYLPRYDITLEPGDILWNAPWWWHRIENSDGLSIGLAIRNNKVTRLNLLNNPIYTLAGRTYLLYNTWIIGLYERLWLGEDEHFSTSQDESADSNVLFQIQKLAKKYPNSIDIDSIK